MPRPHPPEFRQRAVELARMGEKPVARIAEDLGISDSCLNRTGFDGDSVVWFSGQLAGPVHKRGLGTSRPEVGAPNR